MNLPKKLLLSLLVAAVATGIAYLAPGLSASPALALLLAAATAATALLVTLLPVRIAPRRSAGAGVAPPSPARTPTPVSTPTSAADGARERGTVKWFNTRKGYGFIIRETGEEIFVHFRSIRDGGRGGLRDGQAVTFTVSETDKGPQAEDVEAGA